MATSIFVERKDKPEYLLVGMPDSPDGCEVYVNSKRVFDVLKSALDSEKYREVNRKIQQEIMDAVYGKGVVDLERDMEGV